jgi:hypothetical protein
VPLTHLGTSLSPALVQEKPAIANEFSRRNATRSIIRGRFPTWPTAGEDSRSPDPFHAPRPPTSASRTGQPAERCLKNWNSERNSLQWYKESEACKQTQSNASSFGSPPNLGHPAASVAASDWSHSVALASNIAIRATTGYICERILESGLVSLSIFRVQRDWNRHK